MRLKQPVVLGRRMRKRQKLVASDSLGRYKNTKYFLNTVRIVYLMSLFKNPTILAQHLAREITRIKNHRQLFYAFQAFIQCQALFPDQFVGLRIGIYGKINASTRTRLQVLTFGKIPNLGRFLMPVNFGFAQARARTGVFGIKVWYLGNPLPPKDIH